MSAASLPAWLSTGASTSSVLAVFDHLHMPVLTVLLALVLTGVPFAPGRYFATAAAIILQPVMTIPSPDF